VANEQKKTGEAQQACTTANERLEKAFTNNEELCDMALKEKEDADALVAELERAFAAEKKALEEEIVKSIELAKTLTSERAVYPNLYGVAVEQFKQLIEFQIAIDVAVATSLARWEGVEVGASNVATAKLVKGQTRVEIIENLQ